MREIKNPWYSGTGRTERGVSSGLAVVYRLLTSAPRSSGWALGMISLLAIVVACAGGCASKQAGDPGARPGDGIAEYRRITTGAEKAMRDALEALATVGAQSNQCSAEVLSRFSAEVNRLQVDSIEVRARSQAMQARGDAYFERWHENMARVKDRKVRALAEARRPLLQESFGRIKSLSQEGHEAFKPFLSDLRQLRNGLEKDPASVDADPTRERIKTAMENGKHVEQCLVGITRELDSMTAMITPSESALQK